MNVVPLQVASEKELVKLIKGEGHAKVNPKETENMGEEEQTVWIESNVGTSSVYA